MYKKSSSVKKTDSLKFKELIPSKKNIIPQTKSNKHINLTLSNETSKKDFLHRSNLPKLNGINSSEPVITSPNLRQNSKKNLLSTYLSLSTKKDNIIKLKLSESVNHPYFRQKSEKANKNNNLNENNKHNLLDDIKIINNLAKNEMIYPNSLEYDYSLMIKKLDNWDKDHCYKNKMDLFSLHKTLNNYYKNNNLVEEKNNLDTMDKLLQEKVNYYRYKENKIYGILGKKQKKNSINTKKEEESDDTNEKNKRNIFNSQVITNLNKSYAKNKIDFNNKLMKERLSYEHQLHKELIFVNNIIFNKKYIKKEKIKEMNAYFEELDQINIEYNIKKEKFMKEYYFLVSAISQEHNTMINEKLNEVKILQEKNHGIESPKKKKAKKEITNEIKDLEFQKKSKMTTVNNQMKEGMNNINNQYNVKFKELYKRKEKLENELNIINAELNYYKNINEELLREHQLYYLDILKKGKDCRKEGLVWVVRNLLELKINLEYHHFPKYLTHEHIDYLKNLAYLILEEVELKIILKILKKKQKDDRENAKIEYMNLFDTLTNEVSKNKHERNYKISIKKALKSYDEETLKVKDRIDKKFIKVYKNNEEALKIYLAKSLEDEKLQNFIYYIKKALYGHNNTNFVKENKSSIIEAFMGKTKNKDLFGLILNITKRLHEIDTNKKNLINKEKEYFLERVKNSEENNTESLDYLYNKELIKNCLFGNKIDF